MLTGIEIQPKDVAELDVTLLAEGLNTFRLLANSVDGDIYTDAPECRASVGEAQDALLQAYDILERISLALLKAHNERAAGQAEALARHILEEAEEAFAGKSLAEEKALDGNWPRPRTVSDYLYWIEDEASRLEAQGEVESERGRNAEYYLQALHELAGELRDLGFEPSPPAQETQNIAVQA